MNEKSGVPPGEDDIMKIKQTAAVVMAVSMAASLAACGGASSAESAAESKVSEAASEIASDVESKEAGAAEDAAKESKDGDSEAETETEAEGEKPLAGQELVMATNAEFEPWEFHDGDNIVGIDAEVAQAVAEELGATLKIEDMAFDAIIPSVVSGKSNFGMAAISVTPEREASVDFTNTYASSALVVLVKSDNTEITGADDTLSGKKVGVQTGTTGDLKATELVGDENVERYNSYFEAVQSLKQGKIDAVLIDTAPAKAFLGQNDDLKQVGEELDKEEYAIAVQKGNTELVEQLNGAIKTLQENGTIDEIMNKYIPAE